MHSGKYSTEWVTISTAAALVDVTEETISKLAVPWQEAEAPHRIRFRLLVLEAGSKGEPRFFAPDLQTLLLNPESPLDARASDESGFRSQDQTTALQGRGTRNLPQQ